MRLSLTFRGTIGAYLLVEGCARCVPDLGIMPTDELFILKRKSRSNETIPFLSTIKPKSLPNLGRLFWYIEYVRQLRSETTKHKGLLAREYLKEALSKA